MDRWDILAIIVVLVAIGPLVLTEYRISQQTGIAGGCGAGTIPDWVNEQGGGVEQCSYLVYPEGSIYYAKNQQPGANRGKNQFSGTVASTVIQSGLDGLTAGRAAKEKVCLRGSFTITAAITIPSFTILVIDGSLTAGNSLNARVISMDNINDVEIMGGRIIGNSANQASGPGIKCQTCNRVHIHDVYLDDIKEQPINIAGDYNIVRHNIITNSFGDGISVTGNNIVVQGNTIGRNREVGISVGSGSNNVVITGNTIDNEALVTDGHGINVLGATYTTIVGNIVRRPGTGADGIVIQKVPGGANPLGCTIVGNTITDGAGAGQDAVSLLGGVLECIVSNNEIRNWALGVTEATFEAASPNFNRITGNIFVSVTTPVTKVGADTIIQANTGYVTENWGATSVADGGTISHGLAGTPDTVTVTCSIASQMCSVTALAATTFTVAIKTDTGAAGTTQTIYWYAVFIP